MKGKRVRGKIIIELEDIKVRPGTEKVVAEMIEALVKKELEEITLVPVDLVVIESKNRRLSANVVNMLATKLARFNVAVANVSSDRLVEVDRLVVRGVNL